MNEFQFVQWLKEASRLGFAFAILHDASPFYKDASGSIVKALKSYAKSINISTYEFGCGSLVKAGDKNKLNELLVTYLDKRQKYEAAQANEDYTNDYLN